MALALLPSDWLLIARDADSLIAHIPSAAIAHLGAFFDSVRDRATWLVELLPPGDGNASVITHGEDFDIKLLTKIAAARRAIVCVDTADDVMECFLPICDMTDALLSTLAQASLVKRR